MKLLILPSFALSTFLSIQAQAQNIAAPGHRSSMMAESPFTNYTAGIVVMTLLVALLVAVLLIGGLLVVNLGMMSKRAHDRRGGRTPSDVAILKNTIWPAEREETAILPAEDEGQGGEAIVAQLVSQQPPSHRTGQTIDVTRERTKRENWRRRVEAAERERDQEAWERAEEERRGRTERPPNHEPEEAA